MKRNKWNLFAAAFDSVAILVCKVAAIVSVAHFVIKYW